MRDYHVPKREIPVEVRMSCGTKHLFTLFLSTVAESHRGLERPSDILNRGERFVPMRDGRGSTLIINTENIMVMTTSREIESVSSDENDDVGVSHVHQHLHLTFVDQSTLKGDFVFLPHQGRTRIQDVLNESPRFVLLHDENVAHIVHTKHVVTLAPQNRGWSESPITQLSDDEDSHA